MDERLKGIIDSMEKDLVETVQKWVRIQSVKGTPEENAPFGAAVKKALTAALEDAARMGFAVRDFDGYAGDIQMGQGDETLGILCHVDVVPAGDGWEMDPFGAEIRGDKLFGRGTSDDKGPAVAALYAMKAVMDAGIPLKKKVRLILGCDEETGWGCMAHYRKVADMPEIGFSPDASFPIINTEKGMCHLKYHAPAATEGLKVLAFNTGERPNVVPGYAEATVLGDESLIERVGAFAKETGLNLMASHEKGVVTLKSTGITGHAAYPESAKNAIGQMLVLLDHLGVRGPLQRLAQKVGLQFDCEALGCRVQDKVSGAITLNMGIIRADETAVEGVFDIRYPVLASPEGIIDTIRQTLAGFTIEVTTLKAPHHVPEESELVRALLMAYHEETGLPMAAMSTGGGTYARCLKQGVAFGCAFPGDEDLAHQAGEYISIQGLMKSVSIFANGIIRLAGA